MTQVSNDDRISAALLRLEQAERLVMEARKIFSYADTQDISNGGPRTITVGSDEPVDGLYPGQVGYIEEPECEE